MFLFAPNEKQIEKLKEQNKIVDLIKIIDSLIGKTDEKNMSLFREAAFAAACLLPSNPDSACKQLIEIAASQYHKGGHSPLPQRIILLEAMAATQNGHVLEEILENTSIWVMQSREFTDCVEATLTGSGEISAAILIKADRTKTSHDRSFMFRLLGRTRAPGALNYLADCLNGDIKYELREPLIKAISEFGKEAVDPLAIRLRRASIDNEIDLLTDCLLKIGERSAASAIIDARQNLKGNSDQTWRIKNKLAEAAKKLGFRCDEHQWHGCICDICGEVRDEQHQLSESGCTCLVCKKEFHDWDGCICRKCSADRHEWASMGGRGIYLGEYCQRCHEKKYWSRDD